MFEEMEDSQKDKKASRKRRSEWCSVPGCRKNKDKSPDITFHNFPMNRAVRDQWIVAIHREEGPLFQVQRNSTYVCSSHFRPDDYPKRGWTQRRTLLKKDAVPSVFDDCDGWERINERKYLYRARKPPKDRSQGHSSTSMEVDDIGDVTVKDAANDDLSNLVDEQSIVYYGPQLPSPHELLSAIADHECVVQRQQQHIGNLEHQLSICRFGLRRFGHDDSLINFYTGFQSYHLLLSFYECVSPTATNMKSPYYARAAQVSLQGRPRALAPIDELFMVLCRLRLGLLEADLAERFSIAQSTVSRQLVMWINFLYMVLGALPIWLSREAIRPLMPRCFEETFPDTRVILDCTEIKTQYASSLKLNSQLYSFYKNAPTFKGLIGIAPHGAVTFVSALFTGSISDVAITQKSGVYDLLEAGDRVMADKGFTIFKPVAERGCSLNIPPFLTSRGQFTQEEIQETEEIASMRIHVERAIRSIKENRIFDSPIPLSQIGTINQIWAVASLLSLLKRPLINTN